MKKFYILLALAILCNSIQAQNVSVTFRTTLKGTGKRLHPDSLRVTGALGAIEQGDWSPSMAKKLTRAANFATDSIYAVTLTIPRRAAPNDTFEFKFINGGDWGDGAAAGSTEDERGVTAPCIKAGGGFGNRAWKMPATGTSFILPAYRFNTCTPAFATGVNEVSTASNLEIAPNPVTTQATLTFDNPTNAVHTVDVLNVTGQVVQRLAPTSAENIVIERNNLSAGLYFARMTNLKGEAQVLKFTIQ